MLTRALLFCLLASLHSLSAGLAPAEKQLVRSVEQTLGGMRRTLEGTVNNLKRKHRSNKPFAERFAQAASKLRVVFEKAEEELLAAVRKPVP